jgi:hypothetical protein
VTAAKILSDSRVFSSAFAWRLERDIRHAFANFFSELIEKSRQIALEADA